MLDKASSRPARILCIQLKQLGDVLMTTPAVRALAKGLPGCEIDFLTQAPAHTIYEHSPYVSRVLRVRWQARELLPMLLQFRRRRYDAVIDFSASSKTAWLCWASRIPRRISIGGRKKSWCFTDLVEMPMDVEYAADRKSALVKAVGVETTDSALDFFLPPDAAQKFRQRTDGWGLTSQPLFAVSPVSRREYKVWPAERYAKICDRLIEHYDAQIFFLIGPGEAHFAENVKQHMRHRSLPIDDSLSLYEAACLLDLARAYVGNDSGLMHLSIARKRPTFSIFGKHSPKHWASAIGFHRAVEFDPGCKSSCHYPKCELECLTGISIDSVWQALTEFLDSMPPGRCG